MAGVVYHSGCLSGTYQEEIMKKLSRRDFAKLCGASAVALGMGAGLRPPPASAEAAPSLLPLKLEAELVRRMEADGGTDPLTAKTVQIAENMEPVIPHPEQEAQVKAKLAALEAKTGKKPNILVFLMDDVGWGDPGCYGGGIMAGAPTPHMDRLAEEGLRLTSCYSQPTCSPSRATMLTGRLPMRHGILRPPMYGEPGGLQDEITLATILSKAGYVTQGVGKWHCGENEESLPHNVGFDDFYGFLTVSDEYTEWRDPYFEPDFVYSEERTKWMQEMEFNKHLVHAVKGRQLEDLDEITIPLCAELDDKWAAYSVDFIQKMAESDKPFFLYHCTRGGHFDNYPNPEFLGKSPAKYPYKDVMVEMDDILGRLVKALEDTGQLENTLVFVTSDNGPQIEIWPDSGYTPFRSGKTSAWEGGVRVPGIVYWKDMITPGQISDGLFDFCDVLPTTLALAGVTDQMPTDRFIDGIDQTSFLLADGGLSNRKFVYYWMQSTFAATRVAEYKMVLAGMSGGDDDTMNPGAWTTLETYPLGKLFNLYLDPKESHAFMVRKVLLSSTFSSAGNAHEATFRKYPSKRQVGG
jgi:arylsulfatase